MENYYTDRLRSSGRALAALRRHLQENTMGRDCVVVGSAPNPVVPAVDNPYILCVNGSAYSVDKFWNKAPDISYLCNALFHKDNDYTSKTAIALRGLMIGDVVIPREAEKVAASTLTSLQVSWKKMFSLSKYDKRVIMADALGRTLSGHYNFSSNVSNGMFIIALALWGGARRVVFTGISFSTNAHAYNNGPALSPRGHIEEDSGFLRYVSAKNLPVFTTLDEIRDAYRIPKW